MDVLDRLFRRLVQNLRAGYPHYLGSQFDVGELYQTLVPYRHNRAELGIEMNQDYEAALMRLLSGERGYIAGDPIMQRALADELASPNPDTTLYREFSTSRIALRPDAAATVEAGPGSLPMAERPMAERPSLASTGVMPTIEPPAMDDARTPFLTPPAPRASSGAGERAGAEAAFPDPSAFGFPLRTPTPATTSRAPSAAPVAAPSATSVPPAPSQAPAAGILAEGSCRFCAGALPDGRRITYCPHCGQNLTVRQCPACSTELELGWRFCVTCGRQSDG